MCRAHIFPDAPLDDNMLLANGIRFGKGLQLVNTLRDLPDDLRQGRCYIPKDHLEKHGLQPRDLLEEHQIGRFRPVYDHYLRLAEEHLAAGWKYTISLPFRHMRLRLACAWPLLLGVKTVEELYRGNILDGRYHIRIPHSDTRWLILRSVIFYPIPKIWSVLFRPKRSPS
jgi:farnesyl-diphosphate farnesyltransferase